MNYKFSEDPIYKDMIPIKDEIYGIIRSTVATPCFVCHEDTEYVDIDYGAPVCSELCVSAADHDACCNHAPEGAKVTCKHSAVVKAQSVMFLEPTKGGE